MPADIGMSFDLPFSEPVLIFALAMVLFLVAPRVAEWLRIPGIVGLILAGIIVGPHGLGLLARGPIMELLGTVGLIYLMFLAGAELDLGEFRRTRARSALFGALTFALPFAAALPLALAFGYPTDSAILLGALFATQTLVAYPVAIRFGIQRNQAVTVAVGATILTDLAVLLILAIVARTTDSGLDARFWVRLLVPLGLLVVVVLAGFPRIGRAFLRREESAGPGPYVFILTMLFIAAFLAEVAGVEPIIGAFLAGLALNPLIPAGSTLQSRVQFVGEAIFIPFFLLSTGMLVDVRIFASDVAAWRMMGTLLVVAIGAKWLAAELAARLFGYTRAERWTLFGLSVSHAAATIAVALIGYDLGLFDDLVLNVVVLIILVSCIVGPTLVGRFGRLVALEEDARPVHAGDAPERILVPLSNPRTAPALVDLALLLRERGNQEPLYALTVVPEEGGDAEAFIANAEKLLSHAVSHAAAADVRVLPLTRVDQNFASGLARGAMETRSSTIVIGWDGRTSRTWMFGSVLDQLLASTAVQVVVAKLGHHISTTKRLVVVLPPGIDHVRGFYESVRSVKRLAERLNARLLLIAIGDAAAYQEQFRPVPPATVALEQAIVARWETLLDTLRAHLEPADVVVVFAAREGTVAWDPALRRLPAALAALRPESFLMLYPAERADGGRDPSLQRGLARAVAPHRIVTPLAAGDYEGALEELVGRQYDDNRARARAILRALKRQGPPLAIAPGVVVPHARLDALSEPMAFLGVVAGAGLATPEGAEPARVVVLVLSPAEQPAAHLAMLADIARVMALPERVHALAAARDPAAAMAVLRPA